MKLIDKIIDTFKKKDNDCKEDEYCPIYLSYLGKFGDKSKEIKKCKHSNTHYCQKYNLINQEKWSNMTKEEKIKLLKDIDFFNKLNN